MKTSVLLLICFLTLVQNTNAQHDTIVVIDYKTNLPLPDTKISWGTSHISTTGKDGMFIIPKSDFNEIHLEAFVYHDTYISKEELLKIDTVYLFSATIIFTELESKFKPNKKIKKNRIRLKKHGLVYKYLYNPDDKSLRLTIENVR